MSDLRTAAQQALEALERQHKDRTAYSRAKQSANATCGEFKENTLSALIESGYMQVMGNQTVEAITALRAALAQKQAEPVQEPVAWVECDGELVWNNREAAIGRNLYTAPPQRKPLSLTDLQEALVLTNLIDRDAIDKPEEYDEGSTLAQIDELHRIIKEQV